MSKLQWFKHYNTAHEGQTIAQLWSEPGGGEVIAFYWTVLEMVSRFEDPERRGTWTANLSIFKSKLGMNRQKSSKLLRKISETFQIKVLWNSEESFEVFVPKWLELQETRGGKREAKIEQNTGRREKREERSKNKEIRSKKEKEKNSTEGGEIAPPRTEGALVWEAYQSAFHERYKVNPVKNGKTAAQCAQLAKRLGQAACEVVRFYLTHNDGYYLKSQHPIGLCLAQAESLHTQWQRGVAVTSAQVRNAEKTITNADTLEAFRESLGA